MQRPLLTAAFAASLLGASPALADGHQFDILTSQHALMLTTVATGLEHPWGLDWLPDGRMVVTERPDRIRIVSPDGTVSDPLAGVPDIVSEFRDGLLDISVSPNFAADNTLFFAYSLKEGDLRRQEIASAQLGEGSLENVTVIFSSGVDVTHDQGFGSRIRFDGDGNMLISVGDHNEPAMAQDTTNTLGSIIRVTSSGAAVDGNPGGSLDPAILAYGLKNPQGLTIDPATGTLWATDHGGTGGGELNRIEAGGNYGWPTRTFGIGEGPRAAEDGDFIDPVFTWGVAPTVALSGLEVYSGDEFPNWQGDLFTGSLVQAALIRVMLGDDGAIVGTEYILDGDIGRVREVRQGPDGRLYVLNDEPDGGIFRIDPVD
ncbi:MAG: PQQ-dependent sugar dehydrogenase [Pseudomonadota bacterium]